MLKMDHSDIISESPSQPAWLQRIGHILLDGIWYDCVYPHRVHSFISVSQSSSLTLPPQSKMPLYPKHQTPLQPMCRPTLPWRHDSVSLNLNSPHHPHGKGEELSAAPCFFLTDKTWTSSSSSSSSPRPVWINRGGEHLPKGLY